MTRRQWKKNFAKQARRREFQRAARAANYWQNRSRLMEDRMRRIEKQIGREPLQVSAEAIVEDDIVVEINRNARPMTQTIGVYFFLSAQLVREMAASGRITEQGKSILRLTTENMAERAQKVLLDDGHRKAESAERTFEGQGVTR